MYLNWYSFSATGMFTFLARAFNWSFRILQKLGACPNVFYISALVILFISWMMMLRRYEVKGKDKGIIE